MMKYCMFAAALALYFCCFCAISAQTIRINEVVASHSVFLDEDGEASDWIELHNTGAVGVNLHNYRIADNANYAKAWAFPDTVIPPGGFLVVRASGKNRHSAGYYTMEGAGSGINVWNTWDVFRFHYLPIHGNFDVSFRVRYLQEVGDYTEIGLMLLDTLDKKSRYTGLFATSRNLHVFKQRNVYYHPPSYAHDIHYPDDYKVLPDNRIRMVKRADSLFAYRWVPDIDIWEAIDSIAFELSSNRGFLGIALTSGEDTVLAHTCISDLVLNGAPLAYEQLRAVEFDTHLQGAGYSSHELHTNFKLNYQGESLYLWNADGKIVDTLTYGELRNGVACGNEDKVGRGIGYFTSLTPGKPNGASKERIAHIPIVKPAGGFFKKEVNVAVYSSEKGAAIRYTLDGSEPNDSSPLYADNPITITSTTSLRVKVYTDDAVYSDVVTQNYFIDDESFLPVVALSTDSANLWSDEKGILAMGKQASPNSPYYGANFWQDWEIPCHFQFFENTSATPFGADIGIKVRGNGSRLNPQKSLRIAAKSRYGDDIMAHGFFPEQPLRQYKHLLLRNGGQDWKLTLLRDPLGAILATRVGVDALAYRPTRVYINAAYWGLLNLREQSDEEYIAAKYDVDAESVDLLEVDARVKYGTGKEYRKMIDSVNALNAMEEDAYPYIESQIDVFNFINYYCTEIYAAHVDWPSLNIKYWRSKKMDNKWRWFLYDLDVGFGYGYDARFNSIEHVTSPTQTLWSNPPWSTLLFRTLLKKAKFKFDFINRTADLLNTVFSSDEVLHLVDSLASDITPEIPRHSARWDTLKAWNEEIQRIRQFVIERPEYLRQHVLRHFHLDNTVDIVLNTNIASAGTIRFSTVTPTALPWQGVYFTNVPITATAIPAPGYRFVRWNLENVPNSPSITITLTEPLQLTAIFAKGSDTGDDGIVINEILYKPTDDRDCGDWIELYNNGNSAVDIGGWILADDDDDHAFTFPTGTIIQADGYVVVCRDTIAFRKVYPSVHAVLGNFDFGYGAPDQVRLYNAAQVLIDSVAYTSAAPWPTGASGTGASIELLNPALDNNKGENWRASSSEKGGTPGARNGVDTGIGHTSEVSNFNFTCVPNPVQMGATISYTLAQPARVQIRVQDYVGRVVAEIKPPTSVGEGEHAVQFSAYTLPVGMYLVRLEVTTRTNHSVATLPIVIVH